MSEKHNHKFLFLKFLVVYTTKRTLQKPFWAKAYCTCLRPKKLKIKLLENFMKKLLMLLCTSLLCLNISALFAQSNVNDTQAAIVNSLLIQQMMQMQQQNMQNMQQQNQQNMQQPKEEKDKKKAIETEDDLLAAGYKRFRIDEDAEDYIVFKNSKNIEYEIDVWAVNNRNRLSYYGTILVAGQKGYKGNPLDDDLDNYRSLWFKVKNDDNAIIKNLGERFSDQRFEIK